MITDTDIIAVAAAPDDDQSVVVEFYASDAAPGDDGFDPATALKCYSAVELPLMFEVLDSGIEYTRRINSIGNIKRTITKEANTFSVELNNEKGDDGVREISNFELNDVGFEGLIVVCRLISRSLSTTYQKSIILFTGRCDKPRGGSKESLTINAKQITGAVEAQMLRRRFQQDDPKGRDPSDPYFEGFRFIQQYGITELSPRQKRSGWWFLAGPIGLLLAHDKPAKTLQYSSFSDLDAETWVGDGFGMVQVQGMNVAYADIGAALKDTTVFMEGPIEALGTRRVDDLRFFLFEPITVKLGYPANEGPVGFEQVPLGDPTWPGNGYYSRSVVIYPGIGGTNVNEVDPAPAIIALALARIVATPDGDGHWSSEELKWSDNAADFVYEKLTSPDVGKLDPAWLDEVSWFETWTYNNGLLFDTSGSDVVFTPDNAKFEGGDKARSRNLKPTATVTPDYFKWLNGEKTASETFLKTTVVQPYADVVPIEPPPPGGGGWYPGGGIELPSLSFLLKRRYTCNLFIQEQMSLTDCLENIVLPSSRMYFFQAANGRLGLKNKKPVDFGLAADALTGDEITIDDVSPWIADKRGYALVDPNTEFSEVRTVTDAVYSSSEGITLSTTTPDFFDRLNAFADGDLTTTPGQASIYVGTPTPGELIDLTLDDVNWQWVPGDGDTDVTVAGFIYGTINAHPRLRRKFRASWVPGASSLTIDYLAGVLTLDSDLTETHVAALDNPTDAPSLDNDSGTLKAGTYQVGFTYKNFRGETLISPIATIVLADDEKITVDHVSAPSGASVRWFCSPAANSFKLRFILENDGSAFEIDELPRLSAPIMPDLNRTGAEVMRVEMSFSDRPEPRAGLTESNILTDSLHWLPGKEETVNQIEYTFRDASQDYRLVKFPLEDEASIKKIHKTIPLKLNGQAVDNYNQAYRIAAGELAKYRDANFFYNLDADKRALLLQEGDVICVTDDGSQTYNLPLEIEEIDISENGGFCSLMLTVRKFANTLYDDSVAERTIPVVIESGFADFTD